jgi:hypothetical protein
VLDLDGRAVTLDEFGGELAGSILAEVEVDDEAAMRAYRPPAFLEPRGRRRSVLHRRAGDTRPTDRTTTLTRRHRVQRSSHGPS